MAGTEFSILDTVLSHRGEGSSRAGGGSCSSPGVKSWEQQNSAKCAGGEGHMGARKTVLGSFKQLERHSRD